MALIVGQNTYITITEAEEFFDGKLYTSEWDNADDLTKERALKEACKRINRLAFKGQKVDESQILAFPRRRPLMNRIGVIGFSTDTGIPEEVKWAQCEEALSLLKYGNSARTKAQEQNVIKVSFGEVSEEYKASLKLLSKEALELLRPYIAGAVVIT